ncbi:type IA DNA topoisomerase, partial [Escherichia coli]|nr:type IA DNA topoisomerase [Escherichia coli]
MLPSETMIWQPEFTDKILSRKPGAVQSGKTDLIKGFKKKSGGTYDAVLVLEDKKTGKLGFPARAKK